MNHKATVQRNNNAALQQHNKAKQIIATQQRQRQTTTKHLEPIVLDVGPKTKRNGNQNERSNCNKTQQHSNKAKSYFNNNMPMTLPNGTTNNNVTAYRYRNSTATT